MYNDMCYHVQLLVTRIGLPTAGSKNFVITGKEPVLKSCIFKVLDLFYQSL